MLETPRVQRTLGGAAPGRARSRACRRKSGASRARTRTVRLDCSPSRRTLVRARAREASRTESPSLLAFASSSHRERFAAFKKPRRGNAHVRARAKRNRSRHHAAIAWAGPVLGRDRRSALAGRGPCHPGCSGRTGQKFLEFPGKSSEFLASKFLKIARRARNFAPTARSAAQRHIG